MLIEESGGSHGVRDAGSILKAIAQPEMEFGGNDLYPTICDKASALAFSLIITIRLWTVTNASAMRRWQFFSISTAMRSFHR